MAGFPEDRHSVRKGESWVTETGERPERGDFLPGRLKKNGNPRISRKQKSRKGGYTTADDPANHWLVSDDPAQDCSG